MVFDTSIAISRSPIWICNITDEYRTVSQYNNIWWLSNIFTWCVGLYLLPWHPDSIGENVTLIIANVLLVIGLSYGKYDVPSGKAVNKLTWHTLPPRNYAFSGKIAIDFTHIPRAYIIGSGQNVNWPSLSGANVKRAIHGLSISKNL